MQINAELLQKFKAVGITNAANIDARVMAWLPGRQSSAVLWVHCGREDLLVNKGKNMRNKQGLS